MRVAGQARQMVCYHCQQLGHMRKDCPQRQGSQGFGTEQSQSVVGQERIQYIPPQHGTGQRSQSQFQGATRAPPISQAGPRGQSMGRGRGRGPQARAVWITVQRAGTGYVGEFSGYTVSVEQSD